VQAEPFLSVDKIGELNLEEIVTAFQLSKHTNLGNAAAELETLPQVDASLFLVVLQIFAKWQVLGTMPDGYAPWDSSIALLSK